MDQSGRSKDSVEFKGGMKNPYTNTIDVDFRRSIFPEDDYDSPIPFSGNAQVILPYNHFYKRCNNSVLVYVSLNGR